MPSQLIPQNITVTTGGTINLPVNQPINYYVISGTSTLSSGLTIQHSGTPTEGILYNIKYQAQVTYSGGNVVTIFGAALTQAQAMQELTISAYYDGSSWDINIHVDAESLPNNYNGVQTTAVPSGGGTVTLVSGINKVTQRFTGTVTLSSSYTITASTVTASEGDVFEIIWNAVCTLSGNSVTIFGISLDTIQALSGNVTISAVFNGSAWIAQLIEGELKVNSVTNPMLAQMPTMTIKGNDTGSTGNAKDLTVSEVQAMLGHYWQDSVDTLTAQVSINNIIKNKKLSSSVGTANLHAASILDESTGCSVYYTDFLNGIYSSISVELGTIVHYGAFANTAGWDETTGDFTFPDYVKFVLYNPGSTADTLEITMPTQTVDGQELEIYFGGTITTGPVVTALTLSPSIGTTMITSITDADAGDIIKIKRIGNRWFAHK